MNGMCNLCLESITNPICVRCLDKQVKSLLGKTRDYFRVHELTKDFDLFENRDVKCIICRNASGICPHCFGSEALKEINTKLRFTFLEYFNLRLVEKTL